MRIWRLPLSLAAFEILVLILSLSLPQRAMAQGNPRTPNCINCVGTDVTPDGGNVTVPANSTQNTVIFTVTNTGTLSGTFTFTCSAAGNVTCGTVTPASKVMGPGADAIVNVKFDAGAVGSGTITLTASGGTTDTGFYNVTVASAAPPTVVLRNHNRDNVDRSLCLTAGAGEAAAWSCGDLVITHSMPGYATLGRERSLTLIHNSATAYPRPPVAAAVTETGLAPTTVLVRLSVGGVVRDSASYTGWTGGTRQVVIDFNAAGLTTGAYPMQLLVRNQYASSVLDSVVNDTLLIVNRFFDEFGAGFSIAGLEQLYFNQPVGTGLQHILWVGGDGSAKLYRQLNATTWVAPKGAFQDTLTLAGAVYTRKLRHGVQVQFSDSARIRGRQIATITRAGQKTPFTWITLTAGLRLASITVPPTPCAKCTYTFGWDGFGNLDSILDPAGRKLDATFLQTVNDGRLTKLTDPDGNSVAFGWDGDRRIISRQSRRGNTTNYEYSQGRARGSRITKVTVPVGRTAGDAATAVTTFDAWNDKGLGIPPATQTAVDTAQAYTKIFGPRAGVPDDAQFWVDRWGAPTKILNTLGFITRIERGDNLVPALVTKVISADSLIDSMLYDLRGNLLELHSLSKRVKQAAPDSNTQTRWTYHSPNTQDSPDSLIDAEGVVTKYAYDTLGLTSQVTAPNGHVTQFVIAPRDTMKGLVRAVDELSVPAWDQSSRTEPVITLHTGFGFNALGNVVSDTSPSGRVRRYPRDNAQRVDTLVDPAGHKIKYVYDPLNRPVDVTELVAPAALTTHTVYDTDVVASVTDPRGVIRKWQYDKAGRQIAETDDWNNTEQRFYNEAGQMDSVHPRIFATTGSMIRHVYDALGRESRTVWTSRYTDTNVVGTKTDSVRFTYDSVGRVLTATTARQKVVRSYFARGDIRTEVQSRPDGSASYRHAYTYDRAGRRTSYVVGIAGDLLRSDSVTYSYRGDGMLNSIGMRWRGGTSADNAVFSWDALARRDTVRYSNGAFIKFAYDKDGALRLVCGNDTQGSTAYTDVAQFTYNNAKVDSEGLIDSIATILPGTGHGCAANNTLLYTQVNTYDDRHQLKTMSRDGNTHTYGYDGSGNMISDYQSQPGAIDYDFFMYNAHNRLEQKTPSQGNAIVYDYDANQARYRECPVGSICASLFPGDPATAQYRRYFYDGLGRLAGTAEYIPIGQQISPPEYDPLGRFLQAPDGGARFGFDGENVVRTGADSNAASWTLVHGPALDDPLNGHYIVLSGNTISTQKTVYFATDGQGQQYAVGDATGHDKSADSDYDTKGGKYAGGTLNAASFGADRSSATTMNQLSFFRNRFYDQQTGRWTQEDPIGVAGGVNLYQFNGNNPVAYTDPFGLCEPPSSPICRFINGVADRTRGLTHLEPVMLAIVSLPTMGAGGGGLTVLKLASGGTEGASVANVALSNTIRALFQAGDEIAGGTAGAIRSEALTGQATRGVFHLQKGIERIANLERILGREPLTAAERQTAEQLLTDLRDAVRFAREQAER